MSDSDRPVSPIVTDADRADVLTKENPSPDLPELLESAKRRAKDAEKNTARIYCRDWGHFTRLGSADAFVLAVVIALIGIVSSTGCATSSQSAESSPFAHSRLGEYVPSGVPYDTLYTSKTVDTPPKLVGGLQGLFEKVEYPQQAKQNGIGGKVLIGLIVRPDGGVSNLRVVESAHPLLDREAMRVIGQTRFEPGLKSGAAVPVKAVMPVAFQLKTQTSP
jgi:TonB family protein